jgi:hypothetical protein
MKSPYDMTYEEQVKEVQRLGWEFCDLMSALQKYDERSGFTTTAEDAIEAIGGDHLDRHRDTLKQYLEGYADALSLYNQKHTHPKVGCCALLYRR